MAALNNKWHKNYKFTKKFKAGIIIAVNLFLLAIIIIAIYNSGLSISTQKSSNKNSSPNGYTSRIYTITKTNLKETMTGVGVIVPSKYFNIHFDDVSGSLHKLNVTLGQEIKAGDIVAEMLPGELINEIKQQELDIEKQGIREEQLDNQALDIQKTIDATMVDYNRALAQGKNQPKIYGENIKKSKNALEHLQIELMVINKDKEIAEIDLKDAQESNDLRTERMVKIKLEQIDSRIKQLNKSIEVAEIVLGQTIRNEEEQRLERLDEIKKLDIRLQQLKDQLKSIELDKQSAQLEMKSERLALNDLNNKLKNCKLTSPATGIVNFVEKLSESDFVNIGEVVAKVVDKRDILMKVTSGDVRTLIFGTRGILKAGNKSYAAVVYKPNPGELLNYTEGNDKTKKLVFLKIDNILKDFKINDQIDVKYEMNIKDNVLTVPKAAIKSDGIKYYVEVIEKGKTRKAVIKKGLETRTDVEIIAGVKEGEQVLLSY